MTLVDSASEAVARRTRRALAIPAGPPNPSSSLHREETAGIHVAVAPKLTRQSTKRLVREKDWVKAPLLSRGGRTYGKIMR